MTAANATPLARAISILGHPLPVLSLAVLAMVAAQGQVLPLGTIALGFAGFSLLIIGWSWRQVRSGRWAHVDASHGDERRTLNRFLLIAIVSGAAIAWWRLPTPDVALALLMSAMLIAVAILCSRWCKLSLHLAFAIFAAGLLRPWGVLAIGAALLLAAAIAWSRLRLARHVPRDLVAAGVAGTLAAFAYWAVLPLLRSGS